jgi:citryl-CoA lyase
MSVQRIDKRGSYWESSISVVTGDKIYIRGYDLEDLIGNVPFTAAAYLLIKGKIPTPEQTRVLDVILTAVLDYSLHKPGTVAARYAVSANPSMAVGMAAAAMSVGQHTLATEDTSRFIIDRYREFQDSELSMGEFAHQCVQQLRARKQRIPGLGHPVFKRVDPRGALLKEVAVAEGLWPESAVLYEAIHRAFISLPGKADIPINDVGVMAAVMVGLGFTPEEGTGLAILSTMPGVIAHVSEELRTGHPIRIVPPETASYDVGTDGDLATDWKAAGWNDRS